MPGPSARNEQPCWCVSATTPSIDGVAERSTSRRNCPAIRLATVAEQLTVARTSRTLRVPDPAVLPAIPLKSRAPGRLKELGRVAARGRPVAIGSRGAEREVVAMDVGASRDRRRRDPDERAELGDGIAGGEGNDRDLVAPRNRIAGSEVLAEGLTQHEVAQRDRDAVVLMQP